MDCHTGSLLYLFLHLRFATVPGCAFSIKRMLYFLSVCWKNCASWRRLSLSICSCTQIGETAKDVMFVQKLLDIHKDMLSERLKKLEAYQKRTGKTVAMSAFIHIFLSSVPLKHLRTCLFEIMMQAQTWAPTRVSRMSGKMATRMRVRLTTMTARSVLSCTQDLTTRTRLVWRWNVPDCRGIAVAC